MLVRRYHQFLSGFVANELYIILIIHRDSLIERHYPARLLPLQLLNVKHFPQGWTVRQNYINRIDTSLMRFLRIRSEWIRNHLKVEEMTAEVQYYQQKWIHHILRIQYIFYLQKYQFNNSMDEEAPSTLDRPFPLVIRRWTKNPKLCFGRRSKRRKKNKTSIYIKNNIFKYNQK